MKPKKKLKIDGISILGATGVHTSPYWMDFNSPHCGLNVNLIVITVCCHTLLSTTCLAFYIRILIIIRRYQVGPPSTESIQMRSIASNGLNNSGERIEITSSTDRSRPKYRLEIQAARVLAIGNLPFCLVNLTLLFCCLISDLDSPELVDSPLITLMMICRELIHLHLMYIPIVFSTLSREFRSAFMRCRRIKRTPPTDDLS